MSNINQLLTKALSTTSEDEAVSCLRMARKKGKTLDTEVGGDYNGHDAKYWYEKAASFYEEAKTYRRMYHAEILTVMNQRSTIAELQAEIKALKKIRHWHVMALQAVLIIALATPQLIH